MGQLSWSPLLFYLDARILHLGYSLANLGDEGSHYWPGTSNLWHFVGISSLVYRHSWSRCVLFLLASPLFSTCCGSELSPLVLGKWAWLGFACSWVSWPSGSRRLWAAHERWVSPYGLRTPPVAQPLLQHSFTLHLRL